MAKALPYFKWFAYDAEGDNFYLSLTDAEGWTYHRLLNRSWMNDGIPSDLNEIARILGKTRKYIDKVWPKLSRKWITSPRDASKLIDPRQEEEYQSAITKSENNKRPGNANAKGSRINRVAIDSQRAYESDSDSKKEKITTLRRTEKSPDFEALNETWEWLAVQYPGYVNEFTDRQLFISVMETAEDIAHLRKNLPLWIACEQWENARFIPSLENFLSKRIFKTLPKGRDSPKAARGPITVDPKKLKPWDPMWMLKENPDDELTDTAGH